MEIPLRHPSGPYNFAVDSRFLENLCTPRIENLGFRIYFFKKCTNSNPWLLRKEMYIFF
jgi:hypothetical protein